MPASETLLLFSLAALALVAVPGPNLVYIATRSVSEGRRAGVASALGVETGTLVHITAAAVGLSALLASSATAFELVRYAGAAYLVFLGVRTLLRREQHPLGTAATASPRLGRAYVEGVLVNVLNPKVALFFLAFLPQFVDPARGSAAEQILILGLILCALGCIVDMAYAFAAGALGGWLRGRPGFARRQAFVTGSIYVALGVTAALAGGGRRKG
jgi:threonine/homoserine/homoserine lactone efflux protein